MYFHTQSRDGWIAHILLPLSLSLSVCIHIYMLCVYLDVLYTFIMGVCMHTHRCRRRWASTSLGVCVCVCFQVSVWVVSTRNNTLPWDLLNGHHLSLSGKALGKLMLLLRCFFFFFFNQRPAEMKRHHCCRRRIFSVFDVRNVDGVKSGRNLTSDCIS